MIKQLLQIFFSATNDATKYLIDGIQNILYKSSL